MRYRSLACDYDGTIAKDGVVSHETYDALERLKKSGRRLLLVTGRELEDLIRVFPDIEIFDRVVAENGALVYEPATKKIRTLGEKPPDVFINLLKKRDITPLSVGHVIVATRHPNEVPVMEVIRELGLELQIIFNKGAVMVLPASINKAVGMAAALKDLKLSAHNVVAIGDAENDHAFLKMAEVSVAVANALPMVKETADLITRQSHGAGVRELIELMLETDLGHVSARIKKQLIELGQTSDGSSINLSPSTNVLVSGGPGGGKTTLATSFLERLREKRYQFCIIDPEGDYSELENAVVYGDANHPPKPEEVLSTLQDPKKIVVANLLAVPLEERPAFFEKLLFGLLDLRARYSRPHWIVIDEAHHLLPREWQKTSFEATKELRNLFLITVEPDSVSEAVLSLVDVLVVIGKSVRLTFESFAKRIGLRLKISASLPDDLEAGEALLWHVKDGGYPVLFHVALPESRQKRHTRKYSEGEMPPERSFFFRGPEGKLNLRAQNLKLFMQIADGVDDETWLYHLRNGDYSRWFEEKIKDDDLASAAREIESAPQMNGAESRKRIRQLIEQRYTAPVSGNP